MVNSTWPKINPPLIVASNIDHIDVRKLLIKEIEQTKRLALMDASFYFFFYVFGCITKIRDRLLIN